MNWHQLGVDFQQKYENTYCRYKSPKTDKVDIYRILAVQPYETRGPDIILCNDTVGDLRLKYQTDAELDFSFPETRYFQSPKGFALMFTRLFQRQWKKGICHTTAKMAFPYTCLAKESNPNIDEDLLREAFSPVKIRSISDAFVALEKGNVFSVVLNGMFALGLGRLASCHWLWFEHEPIAEVTPSRINLKLPQFKQEIQDFLRDTGDYERPIIDTVS